MGSLVLAGCSSSPSATNRSTTTRPPATISAPSSATGTSPTSLATASAGATNVVVTDQIRAELLAAGAGVNDIPVAQYTGLAPGLTYDALDRATATDWAGARLVPAASSDPSSPTQAQVASQDDGSYYIFTRPEGGSWTAHAAGASGPESPCSVTIPPAVVAAWGWPPGSCRPPGA